MTRAAQPAEPWPEYEVPSVAADLRSFARRAHELAGQWRAGDIEKGDAVDRAHNLALALGLHYRLAQNSEELLQDRPTDIIQRVLAAAFGAPGATP